MWMFLLACSIGQPDPASPGSASASLAQEAEAIADKAGALANAARELEGMSAPARKQVTGGEDPSEHLKKMRQMMEQIETLERELQADIDAMEDKLSAAPQ